MASKAVTVDCGGLTSCDFTDNAFCRNDIDMFGRQGVQVRGQGVQVRRQGVQVGHVDEAVDFSGFASRWPRCPSYFAFYPKIRNRDDYWTGFWGQLPTRCRRSKSTFGKRSTTGLSSGARRTRCVIEHRGDNLVVGCRQEINHRIIIRCSGDALCYRTSL